MPYFVTLHMKTTFIIVIFFKLAKHKKFTFTFFKEIFNFMKYTR